MIAKISDVNGNDITNNPIVTTNFGYTNRETDRESDLMYYRARYYEPTLGRFLSQDPYSGNLSSPLTQLSKYLYSLNNPINRVDPTGEFSFLETLVIVGAAAFTGGLAAGALVGTGGFFGAVAGAVLGGVVGGLTGGIIGGMLSVMSGGNFGEGFEAGFAIGAQSGAIAGAFAGYNTVNSAGGRSPASAWQNFLDDWESVKSVGSFIKLVQRRGYCLIKYKNPYDPNCFGKEGTDLMSEDIDKAGELHE